MEGFDDLSIEEIKELIVESLKQSGINPERFEIIVQMGPKVALRGEVDSEGEKDLILQAISDAVGVEEVTDELDIIEREEEFSEDELVNDEIMDDDNESLGTLDIFKSLEEGMPYIPPDSSSFDKKGKKKRRKE